MRAADTPINGNAMNLMRRAAVHDGPMLLVTPAEKAIATRLGKLSPPLVRVRTTRTPSGERRRYVELTNDGRRAVRRSMGHA